MDDIVSTWTGLSGRRQTVIIGTVLATLLLVLLQVVSRNVRPTNALLLLLLLTLLMSETFGFRAGLVSALASDAILMYFFFEPIFAFWAYDHQLQLTLGVFLIVSAVAGSVLQERRAPLRTLTRRDGPSRASELPPAPANSWMAEEGRETSLQIDRDRHIVLLNGREVLLTPTEFTLLDFLSSNGGRVLTHQSILSGVWGDEYVDDTQILRTYVKQLRAKLGDSPSAPRFIRTESRLGYRFLNTEPG